MHYLARIIPWKNGPSGPFHARRLPVVRPSEFVSFCKITPSVLLQIPLCRADVRQEIFHFGFMLEQFAIKDKDGVDSNRLVRRQGRTPLRNGELSCSDFSE
jgi:hypothetical protein